MDLLTAIVDHSNWGNRVLIEACASLADEQLDARPQSAEAWSIRENLIHLVDAQRGYVSLLTLPKEERTREETAWSDLASAADESGHHLRALALQPPGHPRHTTDGYRVEPWVVLVQAVHHAAEHRKQVCHLMRLLGLQPPWLDAWSFGEERGALRKLP